VPFGELVVAIDVKALTGKEVAVELTISTKEDAPN